MPWVLLIEDEARLADTVRRGLEEEGFAVDVARDAREGEQMALANGYDAFVVDRRLPHGDGLGVVEALRAAGRTEPVLVLTALGEVGDRIAGLEAGADDYLPKPFAFEELVARIRALLRRPPLSQQEPTLRAGSLTVDTARRCATVAGPGRETLLNLRPKEVALLELLLRHPGAVVARAVIADWVWGDALYVTDNAIDVTVSGLRQALADAERESGASDVPKVETVRGVGYRLVGEA